MTNPFEASAQYFPTLLQQTVYTEKYSRWDWDKMRREAWIETVDRSVGFLRELSRNQLAPEDYQFVRESILRLEAMPSMRLLAMAGEPARRQNISIYNCSYLPLNDLAAFPEIMLLSMNGTGVGYSVERQYVRELPPVPFQTGRHRGTYYIDDNTEGWVEALRELLDALFSGEDVDFNFDFIRPAGSILRTKGGRASGPAPLREAFEAIRRIVLARQGDWLRPVDAHDIACWIASASISGGVRRSALIALFSADDQEMLTCKQGAFWNDNPQRMYANNSAVIGNSTPEPVLERLLRQMDENQTGEPGLFNRDGVRALRPARRADAEFGLNPCVAADTLVLTDHGLFRVGDIVETDASYPGEFGRYQLNNQAFDGSAFWYTGHKLVYRLITREGYELKLTADHRVMTDGGWIEAQNLRSGDNILLVVPQREVERPADVDFRQGWLAGYYVGNGTKYGNRHLLYFYEGVWQEAEELCAGLSLSYHESGGRWIARGEELGAAVRLYVGDDKHELSEELYRGGPSMWIGYLTGLFDADGSVQGSQDKGFSVRLSQSDEQYLKEVQKLLLGLGIFSVIRKARDAETRPIPNGRGGLANYRTKPNYELIVAGRSLKRFAKVVPLTHPKKAARLSEAVSSRKRGFYREGEPFYATFERLEYVGIEPVYDCSVPGPNAFSANGLYVHNCGEIALRPMQTCNLSSVVCRPEDSLEVLLMKVEAATIIGTIQSMADYFPGFRPEWERNQKEERLLGVDLNGQMDCPLVQQPEVQRILCQHAIRTNEKYVAILGINRSASITTVKPSGNSSQLLNASSGLHARWAPYYIRHVRFNAHSPVRKLLADQGMPMVPENGQTAENATTWVVPFPVRSPEGAVYRNDRTALEQLDYWLRVRRNWTEHQPSVTITYRPHEVEGIVAWVKSHRDYIAGLSFLPANDHAYPLAPYVEISEEEYERLAAQVPTIDFGRLPEFEAEDYTIAAQEVACVGGACELAL